MNKEELLLTDEEARKAEAQHALNVSTRVENKSRRMCVAQAQLDKIPHLDRWLELLELAEGHPERIVCMEADQTLPENTYVTPLKQIAYVQSQQDMTEAGWVKKVEE